MQAAGRRLIAATPTLAADAEPVAGLHPGWSHPDRLDVLAELPALDRVPSAQSAAAYCGLSPREFKSGSSVRGRTRLSKSGNARLRKALYLPTLTAIRFKPPSQGVLRTAWWRPASRRCRRWGACMRKLVMICYGVLKNRKPFDPDWTSKIAT